LMVLLFLFLEHSNGLVQNSQPCCFKRYSSIF
jgi:hypothetical protein